MIFDLYSELLRWCIWFLSVEALESSPHLLVQEQVSFKFGNKRVDISLRAYGITP